MAEADKLPYTFARTHGVLIGGVEDEVVLVHARDDVQPEALVELRRMLGRPLRLTTCSRPAFENKLAETYSETSESAAELVDDLGFGTESDSRATRVKLTRCPLLEAAHRFPDVVCAVHEGLARAAMQDYGADPSGVRLVPFAEPGACLLHLAGTSRRR